MNILELQVRIAMSGAFAHGPGPTRLDGKVPVFDRLSATPRLPELAADLVTQPDRHGADQDWPGAFV